LPLEWLDDQTDIKSFRKREVRLYGAALSTSASKYAGQQVVYTIALSFKKSRCHFCGRQIFWIGKQANFEHNVFKLN
jgi:hypothetical protein